jgi:hypothetical protein
MKWGGWGRVGVGGWGSGFDVSAQPNGVGKVSDGEMGAMREMGEMGVMRVMRVMRVMGMMGMTG